MTKARDLANLIAAGNPLADGAIAVAEVTGAAPLASPTFTGTATAPTINASTALQIGGVAITSTAAELNKMDGVTVGASDINTVTAKAPLASPTFTGDVTVPDKIVHTGDTNTAIRFPADDTVAFETGGSERFRFASAGQLGIAGANYGTSGQVLTSGGSGAAPSWADAGGGAYELVSKTTISSNTTSVIFDNITAAQEQLIIIFNGVQFNSNGFLQFYYRDSSGNDLNGGNDTYSSGFFQFDSSNNHGQLFAFLDHYRVNVGDQFRINEDFNGYMNIYGWGSTSPKLSSEVFFQSHGNQNPSKVSGIMRWQRSGSTPTPAGFAMTPTGGASFTTGDIYVYRLV